MVTRSYAKGRFAWNGTLVISGRAEHSARAFDELLHDSSSCRLQRTFSLTGEKPDSLILVLTVKQVHAVAGRRMVKTCPSIFGDESEEGLPPGIIEMFE